jgi:hypothetical protein
MLDANLQSTSAECRSCLQNESTNNRLSAFFIDPRILSTKRAKGPNFFTDPEGQPDLRSTLSPNMFFMHYCCVNSAFVAARVAERRVRCHRSHPLALATSENSHTNYSTENLITV